MSSKLIRAALWVSGMLAASQGAVAQSCVDPQFLFANEAISMNTCSSFYTPQYLCDQVVSGPALVFRVYIPYPSILAFEVTPDVGSSFDPAIVVNGQQCETGDCPRFADNVGPGGDEQVNLDLDSGSYNVIVTSFTPDPRAACGNALIRFYERTLGGGDNNDGIFRQGFNY